MMTSERTRPRGPLAVVAVLGLVTVACLFARSRGLDEEAFQQRLARWGGRSQDLFQASRFEPLRPVLGDASYALLVSPRGRRVGNDAGPEVDADATRPQLAELLEIQPFTVAQVTGAKNLDDDWLNQIKDPGAVEVLHLSGTAVTDKSLDSLLMMLNLKNLELVDTAISDEAVERLRRLPRLKRFCFGGPNTRSIRLVESALVDDRGTPTVRGKFRSDLFGLANLVRVFARTAADGPPTATNPYGWNTRIRATGTPKKIESGLWEFSVALPEPPRGPCTIETWVDWTGPDTVAMKLAPFRVEGEKPDRPADPPR